MQKAIFFSSPSRRSTRWVVALFFWSLCLPYGYAGDIQLPEIGDPSGNLLSPTEERRLGQAFMRSIRASQPVIDDPLMNSYIQNLGNRLASHSGAAGRSFHFFLIDAPQVNAFAGPGGYIGIYTGLITTTQSESELASVVAHEIAHVTQNHLLRSFDAAQRMSLPMAALAIAALVLGAATDNAAAGVAAATGVQAGMAQRQINFTRANEEEADSFGIDTLAKADYDPQAMPVFFERMGQATRLYDSGKIPEFLRTHPVTSNRIADARGRAGSYRYRQHPDSLHYHLLRTTLRGREFSSPKQAVTFFRGTLSSGRYRNEEGERYGYVQALMRDEQYDKASQELQKLLKKRPEEIAYLVLQSKLLEKSDHRDEALKVLEDGLTLYPGNYPLSIYYAQSLVNNGEARKALEILQQQLQGRPNDQQLYLLAARAAGDLGQTTLGHQYMANHYYLTGALEPAIRQLQIALRDDSIDYYKSAKLTAQLRALEDELAELKRRK